MFWKISGEKGKMSESFEHRKRRKLISRDPNLESGFMGQKQINQSAVGTFGPKVTKGKKYTKFRGQDIVRNIIPKKRVM